jgi:hypothetical protein
MSQRAPASRAVREANRVFKAFKPVQPEVTEYARMQKAVDDNRERLKLERLAREKAAGQQTSGRKHSTKS